MRFDCGRQSRERRTRHAKIYVRTKMRNQIAADPAILAKPEQRQACALDRAKRDNDLAVG